MPPHTDHQGGDGADPPHATAEMRARPKPRRRGLQLPPPGLHQQHELFPPPSSIPIRRRVQFTDAHDQEPQRIRYPSQLFFYLHNNTWMISSFSPGLGFEVTTLGCCGTGTVEMGPLCNKLTTVCSSPSTFMFWDSVHPSETTYRHLAERLRRDVLSSL